MQAVPGVAKITDGYNPATWMLEVTANSIEAQLDVDFADIYANSDLYRYVKTFFRTSYLQHVSEELIC